MSEVQEKLAKALFDFWRETKTQMFAVAIEIPSAGILIIDTDSMEEWSRRCDSTYSQLTEVEKKIYLSAADKFLCAFELPPQEVTRVTVRKNLTYWNLRDKNGKDVGDLHPGSILEVVGQDEERFRVAGWAHKGGFE